MQVFALPKPNNPSESRIYSSAVMPEALAFSPDGRRIAAWNRGGVYVIDTHTGTVRALWDNRDSGMTEVPGVGFTADGSGVVADHDLHPAKLWVHDAETGAVVREFSAGRHFAVESGPDGRLVYVSVDPKPGWTEVIPWDPLTGEAKPGILRHKGYLRQLAVSADGKWMAGASSRTVRVWNRSGPKEPARATRQFEMDSSIACVTGLALSSDGAFVAVSGLAVGVRVWEVPSAKPEGFVKTGAEWQVAQYAAQFAREVAFHPSRPLLAFGGWSAEVAFWDAASRAELKRYAWEWGAKPIPLSWGSVGKVLATAFSPDGLRCAAAGTGEVIVWDVDV